MGSIPTLGSSLTVARLCSHGGRTEFAHRRLPHVRVPAPPGFSGRFILSGLMGMDLGWMAATADRGLSDLMNCLSFGAIGPGVGGDVANLQGSLGQCGS